MGPETEKDYRNKTVFSPSRITKYMQLGFAGTKNLFHRIQLEGQ